MIGTKHLSTTIREYMEMIDTGKLDLNPPYQREYLQSTKMRDGLIESLLTSIEIPSIYLANHSVNDKIKYHVLDGKQRLTSIYDFIHGKDSQGKTVRIGNRKKSKLVQAGLCEDLSGKTFKDLTQEQQDKIYDSTLAANLLTFSDCDEKMEIYMFEILNTNSSVLSKAALITALNKSDIKIIEDIYHYNRNDFCKTYGISTKGKSPDASFLGLLVTAEFICQIEEKEDFNINGSAAAVANKFVDRCKTKKELLNQDDFEKWCDDLFNLLKRGFKNYIQICPISEHDNPKLRFSNLNTISDNKKGIKISYGYLATIVAIFATVQKLSPKDFKSINENILAVRKDEEFIETIADTTYSAKAFSKRYNMLMQAIQDALKDDIIENQGLRFFSKKQKEEIIALNRLKNNGSLICPICQGYIMENEIGSYHFDHIIPYSKGGKTNIENGQVVHELCNRNKSDDIII